MMDPRYREVKQAAIPEVKTPDGATVRVICGEVAGVQGPVREIVTDPEYLDASLPAGRSFTHPVKAGHTVFAYVIEGAGVFRPGTRPLRARGRGRKLFRHGAPVRVRRGQPPPLPPRRQHRRHH